MTISVRRGVAACGAWKALTPLEIASSPVSDDPPLANALSRMYTAPMESSGLPLPRG